jgi:hypothetical protein
MRMFSPPISYASYSEDKISHLNYNTEKYRKASGSLYKVLALFFTGPRTFSSSSDFTKLKITVFLDVTPFSLMIGYQLFGETFHLHLQDGRVTQTFLFRVNNYSILVVCYR